MKGKISERLAERLNGHAASLRSEVSEPRGASPRTPEFEKCWRQIDEILPDADKEQIRVENLRLKDDVEGWQYRARTAEAKVERLRVLLESEGHDADHSASCTICKELST